jgi:hypothetical protein
MEVLANGFKANFWVPIEEEPDIDRFVDEQMMIDMGAFMLVCTLEKVSTCKKKNEEKEWDYYKQITVTVNNICSAADNNINIIIPAKKEEFMCDVNFRYAPEPVEDPSPVEEAAQAAEADAAGPDFENIESPTVDEMLEANENLPEEPAAEAAEKAEEDELDAMLDESDDADENNAMAEEIGETVIDDDEPDFEETVEEEAERLTGDGDDISDEDIDAMFDDDDSPDPAPTPEEEAQGRRLTEVLEADYFDDDDFDFEEKNPDALDEIVSEPDAAELNQTPEDLEAKDAGSNPAAEEDFDPTAEDDFDDEDIDWGE